MRKVRSQKSEVRRKRGSVLIVTIGVLAILTALVLTLGRSMRVEAITSANYAGTVKAEGIEQAAEQYAMAQLVGQPDEADEVLTLDPSNFMGIPVGDAGYFWIIRPNYDDPTMQSYGLMDESGKLNINSTAIASEDGLMMLPGMTQDMADAIIDWRDEDDDVTGSGAESSTYLMLPNPYMAKNAPFESVEELLLVQGFTREYLYGDQMASGHFIPYDQSGNMTVGDSASSDVDPSQYRGIYDYLTVFSTAASTSGGGGGTGTGTGTGGGTTGGGSTGKRSQVSTG
ncbi:MAG TPA: hypothetical protein VFE58_05980, partial [Tepidisphaeraceae bacterium]|nr:hypothetical protein [Tepidisphaeraceae bacterium]